MFLLSHTKVHFSPFSFFFTIIFSFYVSLKPNILIVSLLFGTSRTSCNLLPNLLFQSFQGARSQTLLAGCKLDMDISLNFFKAVKTVSKPGFLLIWWTASKFLCSIESLVTEIKPCLRNCFFVTLASASALLSRQPPWNPFGSRGHSLASQGRAANALQHQPCLFWEWHLMG